MKSKNSCPCGSGELYHDCCGRFIDAGEVPSTPEQLMRSRYTAYTRKNNSYLLDTWHSSTRPDSLKPEKERPVKWVELKVLNATLPADTDTTATVEFVARFKLGGKAEKIHEISEFIKEGGHWFYLKGQVD